MINHGLVAQLMYIFFKESRRAASRSAHPASHTVHSWRGWHCPTCALRSAHSHEIGAVLAWMLQERYRRAYPKALYALLCVLYIGASKVLYSLIVQMIFRSVAENDINTAALAAGLYFLGCVVAVAWCDRKHLDWRGASGMRRDLRHWLAEKHLSAKPEERPPEGLLECMTHEGVETIASAWKAQ